MLDFLINHAILNWSNPNQVPAAKATIDLPAYCATLVLLLKCQVNFKFLLFQFLHQDLDGFVTSSLDGLLRVTHQMSDITVALHFATAT